MAGQLPDAISDVRKRAHAEGLTQAIVEKLAVRLTERAKTCQRQLADRTP